MQSRKDVTQGWINILDDYIEKFYKTAVKNKRRENIKEI